MIFHWQHRTVDITSNAASDIGSDIGFDIRLRHLLGFDIGFDIDYDIDYDISDNGALLVLSLKENGLGTEEGGKVIGEMLKGNSVLRELDLSGNSVYPSSENSPKFVVALSPGLADNGVLLVLSLHSNKLLTKEGGKALAQALAGNSALKELDISNNNWLEKPSHLEGPKWVGDGPGFVQQLTVGINDNGAISSVNLLKNKISSDQAEALISMLKEHPTLKSLCGNRGDETELDMSGKMDGAGDAVMLVPDIIDNGAMTSLNLASNLLGLEGAKVIAACLPKCT
jgi:hypothetical protein